MMRSTLFCFTITIFFSIAFLKTINAGSIIQQTCKAAADKDPNLSLDFCVNSLQSVPSSDSADLFRLGAISIDLVKRNVSETSAYIENLLKKRPKEAQLNDCGDLYSDAGESLGEAAAAYAAKQYGDANVKLSSVMDAASTCEDGFKEGNGGVSPLTKWNEDVFQLTAIALSIVNMNP